MAKGKGRGARDLLYGRRGGGWLPQGHDPTAPAEQTEESDAKRRSRAEIEAEKAERRAAVAEWEIANDIVPGTASWRGDGPGGGTPWEGKARMAAARRDAGVPLNDVDVEALARVR
jgi:hypothetical protein